MATHLAGPLRETAPAEELQQVPRRVVWWKSPEEVLPSEAGFLCRVMARGTLHEVNRLEALFSAPRLHEALTQASAGVLDARSWHDWHRRVGLGSAGPQPAQTCPGT